MDDLVEQPVEVGLELREAWLLLGGFSDPVVKWKTDRNVFIDSHIWSMTVVVIMSHVGHVLLHLYGFHNMLIFV